MNQCKTCKWWVLEEDNYAVDLCQPTKWPQGTPLQVEFDVRECKHPHLLFCERPLETNGFAVVDGSQFFAGFVTAENFGCVRHSSIDTKDYPIPS